MGSRERLDRFRRVVDAPIGALAPSLSRHIARDGTDEVAGRRLLVLSPHPDDETLACGGTVLRTLDHGGQVAVVVATDGRFGNSSIEPEELAGIRRSELRRAAATLGVTGPGLVELDFVDSSLAVHEERLHDLLIEIVDGYRPDVVLSPSPWDLHADHAALGRAARRIMATRTVRQYEYLVWGWRQPSRIMVRVARQVLGVRSAREPVRRPVAVDVTEYVARKAEATACYRSQFAESGAEGHAGAAGGGGPLDETLLQQFASPVELYFPRRG